MGAPCNPLPSEDVTSSSIEYKREEILEFESDLMEKCKSVQAPQAVGDGR